MIAGTEKNGAASHAYSDALAPCVFRDAIPNSSLHGFVSSDAIASDVFAVVFLELAMQSLSKSLKSSEELAIMCWMHTCTYRSDASASTRSDRYGSQGTLNEANPTTSLRGVCGASFVAR